MSGESEEKRHKPTQAKLRRARRDGSIAHSKDVLALAVWPVLIWLVMSWSSIEAQMRRLLTNALTVDFNTPAADLLRNLPQEIFWQSVAIIAPILICAAVIGVVAAVLDNGGFIFSAKPLSPDFNRLNPVEGFKRLFSKRTAVESGFNLTKIGVFAGIAAGIGLGSIRELQRIQACGIDCAAAAFDAVVFPMLAAFFAVFLVAAILDFLLSRELFRDDMRMTDTELKRENKDNFGNPEIKGRRRQVGQEIASGPARMGLGATTLVFDGPLGAVGVRYVANETAAPFVVMKATGERRRDMLAEARRRGIPMIRSSKLADLLIERGTVGAVIPQASFVDVARELIRLKLA